MKELKPETAGNAPEPWMREAVKEINQRAMNGDRLHFEMNQDLAAEILAKHAASSQEAALVSDSSMHNVPFLREALRKYGRHLMGCAAVRELLADEEVACDCGFGKIEVRL